MNRFVVLFSVSMFVFAACGDDDSSGDPAGYVNADLVHGGLLYDKFWSESSAAQPTSDHPIWATQSTNTRTGADTWRCKECHGWDYIGSLGRYSSGSHFTGFAGVYGTSLTPQQVFDVIADDHGYSGAGLSDSDIWDLAKFVREGLIDINTVLDGTTLNGDPVAGQALYDASCASCHGADGLLIDFDPPNGEGVGDLARDNPHEVLHKIRFGHPGSDMPSEVGSGASLQDMNDIGAYCQSL